MKWFFLFVIFSCAQTYSYAQEKILSDTITSAKYIDKSLMPKISMPMTLESDIEPGTIQFFDHSIFNESLLPDYRKNLDFKKYLKNPIITSFQLNSLGNYFNPFLTNETIFNQSLYRLGDRLSFGGNSFGARSVFDQPVLNPEIQDMNIKGATMFIQYKVSDKFKIETRVSISNRKSPFEP